MLHRIKCTFAIVTGLKIRSTRARFALQFTAVLKLDVSSKSFFTKQLFHRQDTLTEILYLQILTF